MQKQENLITKEKFDYFKYLIGKHELPQIPENFHRKLRKRFMKSLNMKLDNPQNSIVLFKSGVITNIYD